MNDTPPHIEAKVRRLLLERSAEERMMMGFDLFSTARAIAMASFPPDEDVYQHKARLFLRLYQNDLPPQTVERVLRWYRQRSEELRHVPR